MSKFSKLLNIPTVKSLDVIDMFYKIENGGLIRRWMERYYLLISLLTNIVALIN